MIISIASGKGGTGKTTVAVNLALSLSNVQLLDCDVEEPNAHLFIKPNIKTSKKAFVLVPQIDETKCNYCGKCGQICEYNAIVVAKDKVLVFPNLCHSCGACSVLCPRQAIKEIKKEIGVIEFGEKDTLQFVKGCLNLGEAMSPPLIRQVKDCVDPGKIVIIDAPPGTSCPVITAIKGSDYCLLVTEPTPFGLNDLVLAVETVRKLKIAFGVIINRSDLGNNKTEEYCILEKIPILMKIPFKKEIAEAYSNGKTIVEMLPEYKQKFKKVFEEITSIINGKNKST